MTLLLKPDLKLDQEGRNIGANETSSECDCFLDDMFQRCALSG